MSVARAAHLRARRPQNHFSCYKSHSATGSAQRPDARWPFAADGSQRTAAPACPRVRRLQLVHICCASKLPRPAQSKGAAQSHSSAASRRSAAGQRQLQAAQRGTPFRRQHAPAPLLAPVYFPFRCVCASRIVRLADTICFRCVIVPLYVRAARDFSPTRSAASRRSQTLLAF